MRYYRRYRNQSSSLQAVLTGTPNASAGILLFLRSSDEKTEPAKFFEFLSRTHTFYYPPNIFYNNSKLFLSYHL